MGVDHYVRPRGEETISREAAKCRQLATAALSHDFNITIFIEEVLKSRLWRGTFEINFFDRDSDKDDPAYVKYNPLELHVDRKIWILANAGNPLARYILAHEVGHLCLHDHADFSYSVGKNKQIKYGEDIHSAEWQANTFAHYLLIPDDVADNINSEEKIAELCAVEEQVARKRYQDRVVSGARSIVSEGNLCNTCFRFNVYRSESGAKCFSCGSDARLTKDLVFKAEEAFISTSEIAVAPQEVQNVNHEVTACRMCANYTLSRKGKYLKCDTCSHEEKINIQYRLNI